MPVYSGPPKTDVFCCELDGWDYSITGEFLHIPPFVVAIRQKKDRTARRARGKEIVDRIADEKRVSR